jgi:hypothetical protein
MSSYMPVPAPELMEGQARYTHHHQIDQRNGNYYDTNEQIRQEHVSTEYTEYDGAGSPVRYIHPSGNPNQYGTPTGAGLNLPSKVQHTVTVFNRDRPNYKPLAMKWPFIITLLFSILGLLSLAAYAQRTLPVKQYTVVESNTVSPRNFPRQDGTGTTYGITETYSRVTMTTVIHKTVVTLSNQAKPTTSTTYTESYSLVSIGLAPQPTVAQAAPHTSKAEFGQLVRWETVYVHIGGGAVTPTPPKNQDEISTDVRNTYKSADEVSLTNEQGVVTGTSLSIPSAFSTPTTIVIIDTAGRTATLTSSVLATPSVGTLRDQFGVPTATETLYPTQETSVAVKVKTQDMSHGTYYLGTVIPTLLAVLLSIPIRVLSLNLRLLQPWHALTAEHGATGRDSLILKNAGAPAIISSVRLLLAGQPLLFLGISLTFCSALLTSLSGEAITLAIHGSNCYRGSRTARECYWNLSVFDQPMKVMLADLVLMAIIVLMILVALINWRSGVSTNPWSIASVASLGRSSEVRALLANLNSDLAEEELRERLATRRFILAYFYKSERDAIEYGIQPVTETDRYSDRSQTSFITENGTGGSPQGVQLHRVGRKRFLSFRLLGFLWRSIFLFVLLSILIFVVYYVNFSGDGNVRFLEFMASDGFGIRFMFTALGVAVTFFWREFFDSKSTSLKVVVTSGGFEFADLL